jgi:hypothetical protein
MTLNFHIIISNAQIVIKFKEIISRKEFLSFAMIVEKYFVKIVVKIKIFMVISIAKNV